MFDTGIKIAGWNRLSFIDYPGFASTVLFFPGCNLRCPYCHNPGIVLNEYPGVDASVVADYLEKRQDVVEGVVLSGGEPTIHEGLPRTAASLRTLGMEVKLDTNGLLPEMIPLVNPDYLALDIKTLPSRYRELGCGFEDAEARLLTSIGIVKAMGGNAEIRISMVPRFIDDGVIDSLRGILKGVERVFLQPYRRDSVLLDREYAKYEPPAMEKIKEYRDILAPVVGKCVIRGQ